LPELHACPSTEVCTTQRPSPKSKALWLHSLVATQTGTARTSALTSMRWVTPFEAMSMCPEKLTQPLRNASARTG